MFEFILTTEYTKHTEKEFDISVLFHSLNLFKGRQLACSYQSEFSVCFVYSVVKLWRIWMHSISVIYKEQSYDHGSRYQDFLVPKSKNIHEAAALPPSISGEVSEIGLYPYF